MTIHFLLDFITPFGIGDYVFVLHPPKEIPNTGGPAWLPYRQGTITQVKLVLAERPEKALVITHPTDHKDLQVDQVIYSIICPPSDHHQSAFSVECSVHPEGERRLFVSEEEIKAYLQGEATQTKGTGMKP